MVVCGKFYTGTTDLIHLYEDTKFNGSKNVCSKNSQPDLEKLRKLVKFI
jgi:hypothetical protein